MVFCVSRRDDATRRDVSASKYEYHIIMYGKWEQMYANGINDKKQTRLTAQMYRWHSFQDLQSKCG